MICVLMGMKIVVDCANGAAYRSAPDALNDLGAEVIPLFNDPNGYNINEDVVLFIPRRWQMPPAATAQRLELHLMAMPIA